MKAMIFLILFWLSKWV